MTRPTRSLIAFLATLVVAGYIASRDAFWGVLIVFLAVFVADWDFEEDGMSESRCRSSLPRP